MDDELIEIIGRYLSQYSQDVLEHDARTFMEEKDLVASGTAYESLNTYTRATTLTLEGVDYFDAIDQGLPPTNVDIDDIRKWIRDKGVKAREVREEYLAKRIRDVIATKGTQWQFMKDRPYGPAGSGIIDYLMKDRVEDVFSYLEGAAGNEIGISITRLIKKELEDG
jgi:hypothetical protein